MNIHVTTLVMSNFPELYYHAFSFTGNIFLNNTNLSGESGIEEDLLEEEEQEDNLPEPTVYKIGRPIVFLLNIACVLYVSTCIKVLQ